MNRFSFTLLSSITAALILCACNGGSPGGETGKNSDSQHISALPEVTAPPPAIKVALADAVFNSAKLVDNKRLSGSPVCTESQVKSLSLNHIDSSGSGNHDFKYHVIDSLFVSAKGTILLLGREWPSENMAWLASYDAAYKLLDKQLVYYDNAEGFLSVESSISNNELIITTTNEFDEGAKTTRSRMKITEDLVWEEIK